MSRPRSRSISKAWAVVALLAAGAAHAHSADVVYVQLSGAADGGFDELVTMTAATLGTLAPVDTDGNRELSSAELAAGAKAIDLGVWEAIPLASNGVRCARSEPRAYLREGYVELDARFGCAPGELSQTFEILNVLPPNYRVVLASEIDGTRFEAVAQGDQRVVTVPDPHGAGARGLLAWLGLGALHILAGYDHLAFLLALLLVVRAWRPALVLVTAFTVAHSLTLAAGALGWVSLDGGRERWAEAAIALSIVYVATENLLVREPRHRVPLTFGFGLVHGLGFAAVLRHYGLGAHPALGLVGFNLGVELGQAALVLVLLPVIRMLRRRPSAYAWTVRTVSCATCAAGAFWFIDRLIR
jgi:hypothetical protein